MKTKKLIGHILVLVGICIPLQAFTHLTIRDMYSSIEYRKYQDEYRDKRYDFSTTIKDEFDKYDKTVIDGSGLVDPFISDDYKSDYGIKGWKKDQIFGYLLIPSIDVKEPIRLDATYDHLDKGVAHIYGTSLPIGGKNRRSVIAGHRGWYRGMMLINLGKVKKDDKVLIDRNGKLLTYVVKNTEIISPSEWEKLKPIDGKDLLTILSCHPIRPPSPYRMLVNCERLEDKRNVHSDITSRKIDVKNLNSDQKSSRTGLTYLFYLITLIGWILLVYRLWIFAIYLKNERKNVYQEESKNVAGKDKIKNGNDILNKD